MIYLNFYSGVLTVADYGSVVRGRFFTSHFIWAFPRLLSNFLLIRPWADVVQYK